MGSGRVVNIISVQYNSTSLAVDTINGVYLSTISYVAKLGLLGVGEGVSICVVLVGSLDLCVGLVSSSTSFNTVKLGVVCCSEVLVGANVVGIVTVLAS